MTVARSDVLKLYRSFLRHGARFADYNFREYVIRRAKEDFRSAMFESSPEKIKKLYYDGLNNVAVVKRQSAISRMFASNRVVVERSTPSN